MKWICFGFPYPGFVIGLELKMVKELDLMLTLGMTERRITESPRDEGSWTGVQQFESRSDPKSPFLGLWLFLV